MKKVILLLVFSLLLSTIVKSQDTIFVKKDGKIETVLCKITKTNHINIFYTENKVGKSIALQDVDHYTMSKETNLDISIKNGIIKAPVIQKIPLTLDELKEKQNSNSESWLIISGIAFVGSGIINYIANNRKIPSGANQAQIDDFTKKQKTAGNLSSVCTGIGGLSLIIGVIIHFN